MLGFNLPTLACHTNTFRWMSLFYLLSEIGVVSDWPREERFVRVGTYKGGCRNMYLHAHKSSQNF